MRWQRAPRYTEWSGYSGAADSEGEQNDDDGEDEESSPRTRFAELPPTPTAPPTRVLQTYIYNELDARRELRVSRRAARMRDAACLALCVFAAVAVVVCLGLVFRGSSVARNQAMNVLEVIGKSTMVQFTIAPKPHVVVQKYGGQRDETTDFHGFTSIHGQLFPYQSLDQDVKHRLSFDGWIRVETTAGVSYEIVLFDHRGYRMMKSVPIGRRRSGCITPNDILPLHDLHTVAERAFDPQDYASFRVNCSHRTKSPVEIVFARIPLVFCPDELTNAFSPLVVTALSNASAHNAKRLVVHGERMLVEAALIDSQHEADEARTARARVEALEMWGNASESLVSRCPYLEAPLATYKPRNPRMLHTILGDGKYQPAPTPTEN